MRVTTFQSQKSRIEEVLRRQEQLEETKNRVSTGQRLRRPSDSPGEIAELLRTQTSLAEISERQASVETFLPYLHAGEATLGDLAGVLREARNLALQASNETTNAEQRQTLAEQVGRLRERARDLGNTRLNGRSLFAGTETDTAPFTAGPPVTYAGNSAPLQMRLSDDTLFPVSITGDVLISSRPGPPDLFENLAELETAIRAGDREATATGLAAIEEDYLHATSLRGELGARAQYAERIREQLADRLVATQARRSLLQDADMAVSILEEKGAETAHEAALLMASQSGQRSLLDYLR